MVPLALPPRAPDERSLRALKFFVESGLHITVLENEPTAPAEQAHCKAVVPIIRHVPRRVRVGTRGSRHSRASRAASPRSRACLSRLLPLLCGSWDTVCVAVGVTVSVCLM